MYENKHASIAIILACLILFTMFISLCCCCCLNCNKRKNQPKTSIKIGGGYDDTKLTNDKVVSSIIEKTMNSMKKVIVLSN
jgi:hypothetical protein